MKQRALILDGSFAVKPIHDALSTKYDVFTIGGDRNSFFAVNAPARHYLIDYSDHTKIEKYVRLKDFSEIIPGCTDISLNTFAFINENFRQIVKKTITKQKFAAFCKYCDVQTPDLLANPTSKDLPVIVKPDDSFSGRGVSVVRRLAELEPAIKYASINSETNSYVIQRFIEGSLNSFSAFRCGNEIKIVHVREKNREGTFGVASSYCFNPEPNLSAKIMDIAGKFLNNEVKKLNFIHVQYICFENDPYPIELFLRCPGDLYPELIKRSTGIDYGKLYCNGYLSKPLLNDDPIPHLKEVRRKTLFANNKFEAIDKLRYLKAKDTVVTVDIDQAFKSAAPERFAVVFQNGDFSENE